MHELVSQVVAQARAAWRYRWHAMGCAWAVGILAGLLAVAVPSQYEAVARVYVDTQSVLRPLLAGLAVHPNVDQMVTMMSRTLISRPNVDRVIRMADMDIRVQTQEERERLITRLTKELTIKSAGAENLYTIAYTDRDPELAKRVVQSLLTIFVEGSLGSKRKDAESAQRFINEQLKSYNARLIAAEHAMTEFKRRNMQMMGDGKQNYYTRLAEAQAALNQAMLALREAEMSRDAIQRQVDGETYPVLIDDSARAATTTSEIDGRLFSLEQKLDGLRMSYTDRHPDIITLRDMIAQLKEEKRREAKQQKPVAQARPQLHELMTRQLKVSLAEAEASVAAMRARTEEYQKRVNNLRAAADAIPQVEAEYTQLTRDYEVTKKNYDLLLSKLESAQISGSMESAGVMDFRVVDPPLVPPVAKAPNRPLLLSFALLVALGAGAALAVFLSQTRRTFEDEAALSRASSLPVFGTVPIAMNGRMAARRTGGLVALGLSFLSLLSAYAAAIAAFLLTTARV